jgi:hypothetical protein
MKKIYSIILFYSSLLHAHYPIIQIEDLNGVFVDGKGKASAESAYYDLKQAVISHKKIEVDISKPEKNLILKDPNTTVRLAFDFSFMDIFHSFNLEGLYLNSEDKIFDLDVLKSTFFIRDQEFHFYNPEIYSELPKTPVNEVNDGKKNILILEGITQNCNFKFKELRFSTISEITTKDLEEENPELKAQVSEIFKKLIPIKGAKDFNLDIKDKKFKSFVKLDSYIDMNFYMSGLTYLNDKKDQFIIQIDSAKLGYFSIKKFIFNKVRELQLDKVEIEGNSIIVSLE